MATTPLARSPMRARARTANHGKTAPTVARTPTKTVGVTTKTPTPATKLSGRTATGMATAITPAAHNPMHVRLFGGIPPKATGWVALIPTATAGTTPSMPFPTSRPSGLTRTGTVMATTQRASNPMPAPERREPPPFPTDALTTTGTATPTRPMISPTTRRDGTTATATATTTWKTPAR